LLMPIHRHPGAHNPSNVHTSGLTLDSGARGSMVTTAPRLLLRWLRAGGPQPVHRAPRAAGLSVLRGLGEVVPRLKRRRRRRLEEHATAARHLKEEALHLARRLDTVRASLRGMVVDERGCTPPARDVATGTSHQLFSSSFLLRCACVPLVSRESGASCGLGPRPGGAREPWEHRRLCV
jgi:hypothetical protein